MPGPAPMKETGWAVGIMGAGQLARMLCESASAMGLHTVVLAKDAGDAAAEAAGETVIGSPSERDPLEIVATRTSVVTFDHEQVDLAVLAGLEARGVVVRPGPATLALAIDKATMRRRLASAGLPVPAFSVLRSLNGDRASSGDATIEAFADEHGWPLMLKATRGGYDGKGVWPVASIAEADRVRRQAAEHGTPLMVEEHVDITTELAVLVARRPSGEVRSWPAAETEQADGVCKEVVVPGSLDPVAARDAEEIARRVATMADVVGVLAVELFWSNGALMVNEIAARPHNSGHWTMEGAVTSQFENHLRGVLDLPLGSTERTATCIATVNVFGDDEGCDPRLRLSEALAVPGAHVHLYGKAPRPGRKLGHVTVSGTHASEVRSRGWKAARALGTPVPPTRR